jgi:hypothetical protein
MKVLGLGKDSLRAEPYCQYYEHEAHRHGPYDAEMENPVEPFDTTIFDQTVIETNQRQSDEGGRERKGQLGDEGDDIGCLDHVPSCSLSVLIA